MSGDRWLFKITVVGDGQVGKTSLIQKFTKGSFQEEYIKTIGAQFSIYEMEIDGDFCELFFWDIAGQDEFHFLRPSFYKDSKAAIMVYSLEENDLGKNSLKHIPNWHDDILKFCSNAEKISIIGPTAGFLPDPLFKRGINVVGSTRIYDAKEFLHNIRNNIRWGSTAKKYTIEREKYAGYAELLKKIPNEK